MADISTAVSMARVPILGEDGRISDDYIPAAIGQGVKDAQDAATAAESAKTAAETARDAAVTAKDGAESAKTAAESAKTGAESAKDAAESAKTSAEGSASQAATSAQKAANSAQQAADKADSVLDHYIASATATTLEPGSEATASVADQVLTLGIPRGDKGDKGEKGDPGDVSAVQTADGSDLSVSTDAGTVTIDDSALRERIAELENQAANVVTGTSAGYVAHGEDAFPQKPREVRIKGKTWVNRWQPINGSYSGITVLTDETGLITLSGTATAESNIGFGENTFALVPGKSYTVVASANVSDVAIFVNQRKSDATQAEVIVVKNTPTTFQANSEQSYTFCSMRVASGTTVNASFRVMLVDGTEAPDCFTPCASITSVQPENLVTAGKNLAGIVTSSISSAIAMPIKAGQQLVASLTTDQPISDSNSRIIYIHDGVTGEYLNATMHFSATDTGRIQSNVWTCQESNMYKFIMYDGKNNVTDLQLELGSTATSYEPPSVTQTPLPEVELRSLPNGTCDELVIKADGTCEVERNTVEVTFDGSEDEDWVLVTSDNGHGIANFRIHSGSYATSKLSAVCDTLPVDNAVQADATAAGILIADKSLYIRLRSITADTVKELKTWLGTNPTTVVFTNSSIGGTEPQSPVTLPALPAPTFNQYHDSAVPSDTSTEYARDINIAFEQLAKQIAGTASAVAVREASTIEEE